MRQITCTGMRVCRRPLQYTDHPARDLRRQCIFSSELPHRRLGRFLKPRRVGRISLLEQLLVALHEFIGPSLLLQLSHGIGYLLVSFLFLPDVRRHSIFSDKAVEKSVSLILRRRT
ncbi:MAG: hypothetical protein V7642_6268 [Burkholderiales bacterium]